MTVDPDKHYAKAYYFIARFFCSALCCAAHATAQLRVQTKGFDVICIGDVRSVRPCRTQ